MKNRQDLIYLVNTIIKFIYFVNIFFVELNFKNNMRALNKSPRNFFDPFKINL